MCQDNTVSYYYKWEWSSMYMQHFPDSPCYCKAGYKSPNRLSPCQQCSPGSSTLSKPNPYYEWMGSYYDRYITGSTVCNCMRGYFSPTGNDNYGPCQKCPIGTSTIELYAGLSSS